MEHKFPGSGKVVLKWKKKYGFEGKFQTSELLKLQVDLKVDINKCLGRKKENKIKEYRISDEWLKESKRRDGERNTREQKKLQKAQQKKRVDVKSDDETQGRRKNLGVREEEEGGGAAAASHTHTHLDTHTHIHKADSLRTEGERKKQLTKQRRDELEEKKRCVEEEKKAKHRNSWSTSTKYDPPPYSTKPAKKGVYPVKMLTNHEERFRPGLNNSDHGSDDASDNENGTSKHGHRDMYPLVQVANPRYGQAMGEERQLDPNPTMLVYRPWSAHDRKKATSDIVRPSAQGGSAEEFIREMRGVCDSYMLNGHEIYDCLRDVLKNDWCRVSGDFNGSDANGGPRPNGDNDLQLALNALYDRVRAMWPPRVDYSKIGETQQKEDESPADYRYRLEVVFQANSGIQPNIDVNSPYQQQLKMGPQEYWIRSSGSRTGNARRQRYQGKKQARDLHSR